MCDWWIYHRATQESDEGANERTAWLIASVGNMMGAQPRLTIDSVMGRPAREGQETDPNLAGALNALAPLPVAGGPGDTGSVEAKIAALRAAAKASLGVKHGEPG